jgi:hypothetical protein
MANKYKIQAKGGEHVVITLDSSDVVLGVREFSTRELSAVAEGGAVNLIAAPADTKVFIGLDHEAIYKADGTTLWGTDLTTAVSNLNAFFLTTPHNLEDLDDIPAPTNGRFLKYSSDAYSWEEASGGSSEIETAINITNSDAAFSHMTTPITVGTSIEAVLRDMLEKYNRTTISLTNIKVRRQDTDGSYPASETTVTSTTTSEVGRGIKIVSFTFSIADNTQTIDDSVKFRRDSVVIESGFSDTSGTKTLSSTEDQDPTSSTDLSYNVQAVDDGGAGLPDQTITSGSITFKWRFRIKVGSSTTTAITSNSEAATLFTGMTTAYDELRGESDFNVTATTGMDTALNYTWIAYPASFGNLNKIDLAGTDVLSDFQSPVDYDITNDYGTTISYRFYRSDFDDAFAEGQVLTIDF